MTVFHADLSDTRKDVDVFLAINGELHPLRPHTAQSRLRHRGEAPHLCRVPDERLTHFLHLPAAVHLRAAVRVHIAYRDADGSRPKKGPHVGHATIYIPPSEEMLKAAGGSLTLHEHIDWISTAKTFLFHHSDLNTQDPDAARTVWEHMDEDKARANYDLIDAFASVMREAGEPSDNAADPSDGWAVLEAFQYQGEEVYLHQPRPDIIAQAAPAVRALMLSTKNDVRLQDKKWRQLEGFSTQSLEPQHIATLRAEGEPDGGPEEGPWSAAIGNKAYVDGTKTTLSVTTEDAQERIVRVEIENIFVRYLAAYIQFLDADGQPLKTPDWVPEGGVAAWLDFLQKHPDLAPDLALQEPDFRFLGTIDPIDTILAVPNILAPGRLLGNADGEGVRVRFPENAAGARIYGCGLGTGVRSHGGACLYGGAMTIGCNLLLPAVLMAFEVASISYKPLYKFIQGLLGKTAVKVIGAIAYVSTMAGLFSYSVAHGHPDWTKISSFAKTVLGKVFGFALEWIENDLELAAEKVAEQIPFAGWIVATASIVSDVAQMAETIVEVTSSPWEIPNTIHVEVESTVRLRPDPRHGAFPAAEKGRAGYSIKMVYKRGTPARIWHDEVHGVPGPQIEFKFRNPLGDQIKLEADYLIDGEVRATATTGWLPNDSAHAKQFDLVLVERAVALTPESVYHHASLLTFRDGAYSWMQTAKAPGYHLPDPSDTGNAISEWNGLALSQRRHRLGWAWKAAGLGLHECSGGDSRKQLNTFMSVGIPGAAADNARFPTCGFTGRTNVVFDPFPPRFLMKDGSWVLDASGNPLPDPAATDLGDYWVDPRKAGQPLEKDGGYYLRLLPKDGGAIDPNGAKLSYGRFQLAPESMALHPSGFVVGLSHEFHKIQVAQLERGGAADDALPVARVYSGKGSNFNGSGGRPGLLVLPLAVTCTYDGTILILENLRSGSFTMARIQAFDVQGNPVNAFPGAAGKASPFLELPVENRTYLDIAAVGDQRRTYVFALYHEGGGDKAGDYRLAVYQTGEAPAARHPLLTTEGVAVARIAADMWSTVYTLNFEMTTDGAGHPAGPKGEGTGNDGRTVPSLSAWVPRPAGA